MPKQTIISVRLTDDLLKKFDAVTKTMRLGKADFIRGCIQKLCDDNQVLIDFYQRIGPQLEFIKNELAKLPQDLVIVKNGSWADVKDSSMYLLCKEFWRASKTVFAIWLKVIEKYDNLTREFSRFLSDLDQWEVHISFWLDARPVKDVSDIIGNPEELSWLDTLAVLKATFSYATKKAIEETSAERIVRELLETEEKQGKEKPLRLAVNARGESRLRAKLEGEHYLSAVYTEKVES